MLDRGGALSDAGGGAMGVTTRRLGLAALILVAVLLPLRSQHRQAIESAVAGPGDRRERFLALLNQRNRAELLASAVELRDSALEMTASPKRAGLRDLMFVGFPPGTAASKAELAGADTAHEASDARVRTGVIIYNDANNQRSYRGALIRKVNDVLWCIAIAPGYVSKAGGVRTLGHLLEVAAAPCQLMATFGPPGAGVRAWLDATRYAEAASDDWQSRPKGFVNGEGPFQRWGDRAGRASRIADADGTTLAAILRPIGVTDAAMLLTPPYEFGASGLRCLKGDQAACQAEVLQGAIRIPGGSLLPSDLTSLDLEEPDTTDMSTIRPPVGTLVSGIVGDHTRQQFASFWKSDRPFPVAFQDAFGEPVGAWTARWARRQWDSSFEAKYRGSRFLLGVTLDPWWPLLMLGWIIIGLTLAGWIAKRRTA